MILLVDFKKQEEANLFANGFLNKKIYDSYLNASPTNENQEENRFNLLYIQSIDLLAFDYQLSTTILINCEVINGDISGIINPTTKYLYNNTLNFSTKIEGRESTLYATVIALDLDNKVIESYSKKF